MQMILGSYFSSSVAAALPVAEFLLVWWDQGSKE